MKTLYLECKMGAAGDMMASALLDLFDDKEALVKRLNDINIPRIKFILNKSVKCGIVGSHLSVMIDGQEEESLDVDMPQSHSHSEAHEHNHDHGYDHAHDHHHDHNHDHDHHHDHEHDHDHHHDHKTHSMYEIEDIIENLAVSKETKSDIREVYQILASAESNVHGVPVSEIHFHEVGELDAIADISAVCCLMHELDPDKIVVSPINVGGGRVRTAHGILPVPAPATAFLLKDIPTYTREDIMAELCTPTGAALIKYFAFEFSSQPVMTVSNIGYGMGNKDFPQANCVRAMLGEAEEDAENVVELSCNIDDMTPEEIGFASEILFEKGALDVYTIPIGMKKSRPGVMLNVICATKARDEIIKTIFNHTTTIGIRQKTYDRVILSREMKTVDTIYGPVRVKTTYGYDVKRSKLEYDDLAGIARTTGKSLRELRKDIEDSISEE
jgi:uncharacterized protein (TIGR00299 family) protein